MTEHHDISAGSAQEHMQSRGRHYDIIREALATYDEWMLDDDYNPGVTLKTIIDRMRERVEMTDASGVTFNVAQPTRSDLSSDQIMEILRRTVQGELLGLLTIGRRRNDGSDARIPSMSAEVLAREFRAASQPSPAATVEREQIEWWEGQMQLAMAEIERLRVESLERQEQVCETNDRLMAAQDQAHLSAATEEDSPLTMSMFVSKDDYEAEKTARIVSRLRNFAVWNNRQSHYEPVPLCKEAADEIEKLRRNLRHWREECGKLHARMPNEPQAAREQRQAERRERTGLDVEEAMTLEEDCGCVGAVIGQHERSCPLPRPKPSTDR